MAFSDDMDKALASMASARRAAVKSAFTTLQTAVSGEQTAYGTKSPEKTALNEKLIELGRNLSAQMR